MIRQLSKTIFKIRLRINDKKNGCPCFMDLNKSWKKKTEHIICKKDQKKKSLCPLLLARFIGCVHVILIGSRYSSVSLCVSFRFLPLFRFIITISKQKKLLHFNVGPSTSWRTPPLLIPSIKSIFNCVLGLFRFLQSWIVSRVSLQRGTETLLVITRLTNTMITTTSDHLVIINFLFLISRAFRIWKLIFSWTDSIVLVKKCGFSGGDETYWGNRNRANAA